MSHLNTQWWQAPQELRRDGAAAFSMGALLEGTDDGAWPRFAAAWDCLDFDSYVPGAVRFRRRAYGVVTAVRDENGWVLRPGQAPPFRQSADLIPLYGGAARSFPTVAPELLTAQILQRLLRWDLELVEAVEPVRHGHRFTVGVHMIRVEASGAQLSLPAPEGRHRDGHLYVGMHLVVRNRICGGESRIYHGANDRTPLLAITLTNPLDSVMIDDRRVFHEVSPIGPISADASGHRDMLLIDIGSEAGV